MNVTVGDEGKEARVDEPAHHRVGILESLRETGEDVVTVDLDPRARG